MPTPGDPMPGLAPAGMRWIPGGAFCMGADLSYPEEGPAHDAAVAGFWIDRYAVTNAQFDAFVKATGYVTLAQRPPDPARFPIAPPERLVPGAAVFVKPSGSLDMRDLGNRWAYVAGADWRHPEGRDSTIEGRERDPVVQLAYEDVAAYAAWAGKELPSEAEWEFAARGGLDGAQFCWGDEFNPGGRWMANTWQGPFPYRDLGLDGFVGRAPVGSFPPNGYGLYDMAGNVWEWTADAWTDRHTAGPTAPCCGGATTRPADCGRKVIKGGSYLCAPNCCRRYRPAARQPQAVDTATCHIGFRCVIRV
jgi:sulfatase modifying factor 1